jgi:hypothetical protein
MTYETEPIEPQEREPRRKRRGEARLFIPRPWLLVIAVLSVFSVIGMVVLIAIVVWRAISPAVTVVPSPATAQTVVEVTTQVTGTVAEPQGPPATATLQSTYTATAAPSAPPATSPPLTVIPRATTPASTATPIPAPPPSDEIVVGGYVKVVDTGGNGLNLRESPGVEKGWLHTALEGSVLKVLDGPRQADGYAWWQLEYEEGKGGWGADDWLQPAAPPESP